MTPTAAGVTAAPRGRGARLSIATSADSTATLSNQARSRSRPALLVLPRRESCSSTRGRSRFAQSGVYEGVEIVLADEDAAQDADVRELAPGDRSSDRERRQRVPAGHFCDREEIHALFPPEYAPSLRRCPNRTDENGRFSRPDPD